MAPAITLSQWKDEIKENYNQKDFDKSIEDFSDKMGNLGKVLAVATFGIADKMVDVVY